MVMRTVACEQASGRLERLVRADARTSNRDIGAACSKSSNQRLFGGDSGRALWEVADAVRFGCLREGLQWKARSGMQVRAQRCVPECSEDLERKARWPLGATRPHNLPQLTFAAF